MCSTTNRSISESSFDADNSPRAAYAFSSSTENSSLNGSSFARCFCNRSKAADLNSYPFAASSVVPFASCRMATLMLRPTSSGHGWSVAQLSGEENQPVSEATRRLVHVWLKHAGPDLAYSTSELRERCLAELSIADESIAA